MPDRRFHSAKGPFTLGRLAEIADASLGPTADPARPVADVAALEAAGPDDLSFLDNRRYLEAFARSRAGACLIHPDFADRAPLGMALLLTPAPYLGFAYCARAFYPGERAEPGIHPTAIVDASARLGAEISVAAGAVIGARAEIGDRCAIGVHAAIGPGVVLGADTSVGEHASVSHSIVGARVIIYPGARVGQDGFGFASGPRGHVRIPQLGRVVVGDDVEIGANSCVDRGSAGDTVIESGCMIDNLVQIGHNVRLGRGCVIVSQVGISGSTRLEDFAVLGGQVGVAGHLTIGKGARVAAKSGITKDVPAGAVVGGFPAVPVEEWRRQAVVLRRLARRKGE